jgi:hypothetical protein
VKALRVALGFIAVFGVVGGSLTPLVIHQVTRGSLNVVIPVQTLFGPWAFGLYLWCRKHYGPERTMGEFWADPDAEKAAVKLPRRGPAPVTGADLRARGRHRTALTRRLQVTVRLMTTSPSPSQPASSLS